MTRPFSASAMSGNFDFPPANADYAGSSWEEATNNLRQDAATQRTALRNRLYEIRRLTDNMSDSIESQRQRTQDLAVREEIRRRHTAGNANPSTTLSNTLAMENAQAPTSAMRSRVGSLRHRARSRLRGRATPTQPGGSMQQAVERLNEVSSNLSSLLDHPIPTPGSQDMAAREYSGEAEVNRRRKRRKLESDAPSTGHMNGFSYGYRGQVVPGPLKMDLVSCDGGIHADAARNGNEYMPENILQNNKSVYCTNESKCNIILRHMGETSFCLKKIVIKAPAGGFTAPIQEGMVFISMTRDGLLARTSQYQIQEHSPLRRRVGRDLPLMEDSDENRPLSRRMESGTNRTIPPPISNLIPRSTRYNQDNTNSTTVTSDPLAGFVVDEDSPTPLRTTWVPENPDFEVTTTCNDPSSDEEEPSSAATLADLYRRDRLPPPYTSSDEDGDDYHDHAMELAGHIRNGRHHRRNRRRAQPRKIEVAWPPDGLPPDAEAVDVLAPHAKFFIEKGSSVVSIKFDPPVSGKFVLLKLWSPTKDQNIDIQSVICHGFSGPRFFPAMQMM